MFRLAVLIWVVLGTTLAGSLTLIIVTVPALFDQGSRLIPLAAGAGFLAAVPLAAMIARAIIGGSRAA